MTHLNVEIKARCADPEAIRAILKGRGADFRGLDRQRDTYFHCPHGRLKLREGSIETALIHYDRPDEAGPKDAAITLCRPSRPAELKEVFAAALGVRVVVEKRREIYFIENVKFHIDDVPGLGHFVEIEAIDGGGKIGRERLETQCREYMTLLGIGPGDLIDCSYNDMVAGGAGA